jgi:hypothetical protein
VGANEEGREGELQDRAENCAQPGVFMTTPTQGEHAQTALEDFEVRKLAAIGAVSTSSGLVERRPIEYRRELENQFVRGYRAAESRLHAQITELTAALGVQAYPVKDEATCQMCGEKPYPGCNSEFQDEAACLFYHPATAQTEALAHELFAAAQLAPGEGIEDAVSRIAAALTAAPAQPAARQGGAGTVPRLMEYLRVELSAIPCRYQGDPRHDHDAYWMRDKVEKLLDDAERIFAVAQPWPSDWDPTDTSKPRSRQDINRILSEWNETTGALPGDSGWFCEVEGMMEDAYDLGASHGQAPAGAALEELLILLGSKKAWPSYYFNHKDRYECCDCGKEHDDYAEITHAETCDYTQATADRKRIKELVEILKASTPTAQAAPAAGAVAGPVLCVSSKAFKRMKAGDDSIKAWLPPATDAEDMLLYAAAPTPAAQADSQPSSFGSPELQAMILARCVEKDKADSVLDDAARLAKITQAIRDYHFALDNREHGGVAMARAWNAICDVLNMDWVQGAESAASKQGAKND